MTVASAPSSTNAATSHAPPRPLAGIMLRLAAMALLGVMLALVKLADERGVHLLESLFWRQALSVPAIIGWVMVSGGIGQLRSARPGAHIRRSALGLTGIIINTAAIILLPMAEATTIGLSAPIFGVLLAALLLGEHVDRARWGAVLLGFVGVLVVIGPAFRVTFDTALIPGILLALLGAAMNAIIAVAVRDLSRTEGTLTILFWFCFLSLLPLGIAMLFVATPHDPTDWALLIGIFATGFVAQIMLTNALRLAPVSVVMPMDYSSLLWSILLGWWLFGTLPAAATWAGAPLIIASGLFIAMREHGKNRRTGESI